MFKKLINFASSILTPQAPSQPAKPTAPAKPAIPTEPADNASSPIHPPLPEPAVKTNPPSSSIPLTSSPQGMPSSDISPATQPTLFTLEHLYKEMPLEDGMAHIARSISQHPTNDYITATHQWLQHRIQFPELWKLLLW